MAIVVPSSAKSGGGGINGEIPIFENLKHSFSDKDERLAAAGLDGSYFGRYKDSSGNWHFTYYDKNGALIKDNVGVSLYLSTGYFTYYNPFSPSLNGFIRSIDKNNFRLYNKNGYYTLSISDTISGYQNIGSLGVRKNAALDESTNCLYFFSSSNDSNNNKIDFNNDAILYKIDCNNNMASLYHRFSNIPTSVVNGSNRYWNIGRGNVRNAFVIDGCIYALVYDWYYDCSSPYNFAIMKFDIQSKTLSITNSFQYYDKSSSQSYMGGQFGNSSTYFQKRNGKIYFYLITHSSDTANAKLNEYLLNGNTLSFVRSIEMDIDNYNYAQIVIVDEIIYILINSNLRCHNVNSGEFMYEISLPRVGNYVTNYGGLYYYDNFTKISI